MSFLLEKVEKGDRTMLDYLINISELFEKVDNVSALKKKFDENDKKLLDNAKSLKCKRGRTSYLDGKEIGLDEPGYVLISLWLGYIINKI